MDKEKFKKLWMKRTSPQDCPLRKACEKKVLSEEAESICQDKEVAAEIVQVHMGQKHMWEFCETYQKDKHEKEGKVPREWV